MVKCAFQNAYLSSQRLMELVRQEEYEQAENELKRLDEALRKLDIKTLSALDYEQTNYLKKLAYWLSDSEGDMRNRSEQLISLITPFLSINAIESGMVVFFM